MPSTYTLNNGIELIGTGEQSGTWGDTTNTNLELLDAALDGQVTVTLTSAGTSGSPNNLPITDGSASDGRNRMVIFNDGSDLGATAYVQLTPNDAEKIIYVRNDLSGSRSIILFQGTYSASNDYEVPAGTTAVIYFDGGGSGAVAANVFNNAYFDSLRLGGVSVDKILDEDNMASDDASALATQQSIKAYVDSQVTAQDLDFGGDSGTGAVDLDSQTFTIAGTTNEIETSASGQTLTIGLPDDVTIAGDLTVDTNTLYVDSANNRVGIGTSSPSALLHLDASSDGRVARFGSGTSDTGGMYVTHNSGSTRSFELSADNILILDADRSNGRASSRLQFNVDGSEAMRIDSSGNVGIGTSSIASGGAGTTNLNLHTPSATSTYLKLSNTGTGNNASDGFDLSVDASGNAYIINRENGFINFYTQAIERMRITSTGRVGIGTTSPSSSLAAGGLHVTDRIAVGAGSTGTPALHYDADTDTGIFFGTGIVAVSTGGSEAMRIDSSGNLLVGTTNTFPAGNNVVGTAIRPDGDISITKDGDVAIFANRKTSDGDIMQFRKDGTTVGSISTTSGDIEINSASGANKNVDIIGRDSGGNARGIVVGSGSAKPNADNAIDLGASGNRFKDLYLSGKTYINTTSGARLVLQTDATRAFVGTNTNHPLIFDINSTERMRIDSSGNVGIGVTNPSDFNGGANNLVVGTGSGSQGISIYAGTSSNSSVFFVDGDSGTAEYRGQINYRHDVDAMSFHTAGGFERMRIDSSGNIGIGTSSPAQRLHIQGSAVQFTNTQTSYLQINTSDTHLYTAGAHPLRFGTNSSERMRIDSSGNVGIGTSSPSRKVHVNGSARFDMTAGTIRISEQSSKVSVQATNSAENAFTDLKLDGGNLLLQTQSGGNVGIGTTSPSANLHVNGNAIAKTDTDTTNSGSVTLDFGANQNFVLTLTGNVTLANPSTEVVGQSGFIVFIQDGTGGRTVSLGTDYETAGGSGLTLSSSASTTDVVPYIVAASGRILLGAPQLAFS